MQLSIFGIESVFARIEVAEKEMQATVSAWRELLLYASLFLLPRAA